ncbi:hypothetical protein BT96DRAFT_1086560 [Gymnopus androsaceus JB14]|uniref:Uncharacterized protein n=1 Tax=Gymnopus androsaceus JB14 TaxID=1447944 RepID=A0A6A4GM55_9AGAR|nr:hypothetical protein BT96DRAFT_1086560 [Gymnopus androsaceus JB14]
MIHKMKEEQNSITRVYLQHQQLTGAHYWWPTLFGIAPKTPPKGCATDLPAGTATRKEPSIDLDYVFDEVSPSGSVGIIGVGVQERSAYGVHAGTTFDANRLECTRNNGLGTKSSRRGSRLSQRMTLAIDTEGQAIGPSGVGPHPHHSCQSRYSATSSQSASTPETSTRALGSRKTSTGGLIGARVREVEESGVRVFRGGAKLGPAASNPNDNVETDDEGGFCWSRRNGQKVQTWKAISMRVGEDEAEVAGAMLLFSSSSEKSVLHSPSIALTESLVLILSTTHKPEEPLTVAVVLVALVVAVALVPEEEVDIESVSATADAEEVLVEVV